jgi:iron complex transport system ATP-binding protein
MVTLRLEGVGARYGRHLALSQVSTPAFCGGEVISVIGPNAAGKSTLFKRMAGLVEGPGQVVVEGSRRGVGGVCYMPQETATSAVLTIYESVLLARKQDSAWLVGRDDLALVDRILGALGIADLAFRNLAELSVGQRQLAALAQTLAREPEILLMDEPTSALDLHRQFHILSFVRELARERGLLVFVALHDLNQAMRFSSKVLLVADGTVQASGPCRDVITVEMLRDVYKVEGRIERCSLGIDQVIVDGIVDAVSSSAAGTAPGALRS